VEDLERTKKVIIFVLGSVHELIDMGLVTGSNPRLGPRGIFQFDQIKASGFRPTDKEVELTLSAVAGIVGYSDDRIGDLLKAHLNGETESGEDYEQF